MIGRTFRAVAALLFAGALLAQAPTIQELDAARATLRPLLDALVQVESRGRDDAVGDAGNALGALQIWRVYWSDALQHAPAIGGTYDDVRTRVYAERVVVAYWLRYAAAAVRNVDFERLARVHNGGPRGHKKKATVAYWQRVSRAMEARHAR
jgi:hypothetical protein